VRAGAEGDGGAALPGLIFNGSKCVEEPDPAGGPPNSVPAGRLECTMQVRAASMHAMLQGIWGRPPVWQDTRLSWWQVA
jgi:hypothetical protein